VNAEASELYFVAASGACLSRKPEALHEFGFFRVSLHAGAADSSTVAHGMVRRFLIMLPVISALVTCVAGLFRSRASLHPEHLAQGHQLAVYQRAVHRPPLGPTDRLFWAWLSRFWSSWQDASAFVQSRTVIAWQRARFRDHTVTHRVLFVLLILAHERRSIVHFNMTRHPTAQWTASDELFCLLSPVEDTSVTSYGLSGAPPSPSSGRRQSGLGA
jgi:hypothetical protein